MSALVSEYDDTLDDEAVKDAVHHISRLTSDVPNAVQLIEEHEDRAFEMEGFARRLETEAARSLAAMEMREAFDFFRAAAVAAGDGEHSHELSLRAAAIAIELGEFDEAIRIAAEVESRDTSAATQERASILGIRALWHRDGAEDALERIQRLEPGSDIGLYQWSLMSDDPEDIRKRLADEHEDRLVHRIASGEVGRPKLPGAFLSGVAESEQPAPEQAAADRAEDTDGGRIADLDADDTVAGLQLGSYSRREYAEAHSERVNKAGYSSRVEVEGEDDHKVVIVFDNEKTREEAEEMLLQLREEGFEGFIRLSFD